MKIASHQPSFFPWVGFWNKVAHSDLVVLSAGVKFNYGNYQNRVQLFEGWWTLPVPKEAKDLPIKEVRFDRGHLAKLLQTGHQALGGKRWRNGELVRSILADVEDVLGGSDRLLDLNLAAMWAVMDALGIKTRVEVDLNTPAEEDSKTKRLLTRLSPHWMAGDTYLMGAGALEYLDMAEWPGEGLGILVQTPTTPVDSGTILQLIATNETPLRAIEEAFAWGAIDVAQHTGNRAALG